MKIELIVLGLLSEGNLYGYEISKILTERMEGFADVKVGSIYYAMKKAMGKGWIKKVGSQKAGLSPERFIYQILPEGKKRYEKILKQYFEKNLLHFNIDIGLTVYNALSNEEKKQFISNRAMLVKDQLSWVKTKIAEKSSPSTKGLIYVYTYIESHLKAEQSWLKSLECHK